MIPWEKPTTHWLLLSMILIGIGRELRKSIKRAIELSPSYATAHQWYGEFLTVMGRFDEGLKEIRRAQELDPLSLIINAVEGCFFYFARDYDKGIDQCKKTLEMDPNFLPAHSYLWLNYVGKGMYEEALREAQKTNNQSYNCKHLCNDEQARRGAAIVSQYY